MKSFSKDSRGHRAGLNGRRERAAARFKIMPLVAWAKSHGKRPGDVTRKEYEGYIARKEIEAESLGLRG